MSNIVIIKTLKELEALQDYIKDNDFIAFDTETNGIEKGSIVIGFSVCAGVEEPGYYVILEGWDAKNQALVSYETKEGAKAFMEALVGHNLLIHNAGFDCARVFENWGVELIHSVHTDTLLLGHILNENRKNGLKERAVELYGEDVRKEQAEMKASVTANGGVLSKKLYELYKADADLIARYGAQDAILTFKLFVNDVPQLYEQGLDKFFYEEETMPLCRLVTYPLNNSGLKVDPVRLQKLKKELEIEIEDAKGFIYKEIDPIIKDKYTGTSKAKTFNIDAGQQRAWLLFERLPNEFNTLTKTGRELCKVLNMKVPYTKYAKREWTEEIRTRKGEMWQPSSLNKATGKRKKPVSIKDPWTYMSSGRETMARLAPKHKWVAKLMEYVKAKKLLSTYVLGIEGKMKYGIIRPSFLQHGTTSGRYSSKLPNFQNLPRDDKRVKACIVARPGKIFVGADHSQLEPRVFTAISQDPTLMECFRVGQDFYSAVGAPVFGKNECSLFKKDPNYFGADPDPKDPASTKRWPKKMYPELRQMSKAFALATPYGTTAFQQSIKMGLPSDECQDIIDRYFETYPAVHKMQLDFHQQAKDEGVVYSLFGRPRRIPAAKDIRELYGDCPHAELPYNSRNLLNLAVNHPIQSTGASIMNRNLIAVAQCVDVLSETDPRWKEVNIVLQVHDEGILEGPEELKEDMMALLKDCMETSVSLPGVSLIAEPKAAYDLAGLK